MADIHHVMRESERKRERDRERYREMDDKRTWNNFHAINEGTPIASSECKKG